MIQNQTFENQNWTLIKKLPPSLFTDNYLFKNEQENYIVMKEVNAFFRSNMIRIDDRVRDLITEATIEHRNYLNIINNSRDTDSFGIVWRTYSESAPYCLIDVIKRLEKKRLTESAANYFFRQILNVFEELREKSLVYLTLRVEDIFLDEQCNIKIADFGLPNAVLKSYSDLEWIKNIYQKNTTLSPEIITGSGFNEKSHIFNLGVILFSLVVGYRPFKEVSVNDTLYAMIQQNEFDKYWALVQKNTKTEFSKDFKDLVFKLLAPDNTQRLCLEEIRLHPWFDSEEETSEKIVSIFSSLLKDSIHKVIENAITPAAKPTNYSYGKFPVYRSPSQDMDFCGLIKFLKDIEEKFEEFPITPIELEDLQMNNNLVCYAIEDEAKDVSNIFTALGKNLIMNSEYKYQFCDRSCLSVQFFKHDSDNDGDSSDSFCDDMFNNPEFEIIFYDYKDKYKKYMIVEFINILLDPEDMDSIISKFSKKSS